MAETAEKLRNMTPFDEAEVEINDLYDEAKNWLDGAEVQTQEEADAIAKLLDMARKAKKKADGARKDEAKPFDDGKKAVQEKFKPLLSKADLIADTCKKAVAPFLEAQEKAKREAERKAREEAEAAERAAQEAMQRTSSADIEERAEAERMLDAAKAATANADKLAKDKGHAKGGDRAMSLSTYYTPELTDLNAAIQHYWKARRADFEALVIQCAKEDVRAGQRAIPGFDIKEERKAI